MSSTNTDTLVPSLYQYVETRNVKVFWLLSQPLTHFRSNLFVISETFSTPVVNRFTRWAASTLNRQHIFINILCIESFCPQNRTTERCSVLLPSDTHRKSIASITAVSLPFVTYLLALSRTETFTDAINCNDFIYYCNLQLILQKRVVGLWTRFTHTSSSICDRQSNHLFCSEWTYRSSWFFEVSRGLPALWYESDHFASHFGPKYGPA
jgi:hypothetical protein